MSIVYPNQCPLCHAIISSAEYFCGYCEGILPEKFDFCDETTPAVIFYNDKSKNFIIEAKENSGGYAISAAAKMMYDKITNIKYFNNFDIIASVPPGKASMKHRGYNFPVLLCRELSEMSGIYFNPKCVLKTRETRQQKELSAAERAVNLKNAFAANRNIVNNKHVLLIDDVRTTGSTIEEVSRALFKAGAAEVTKFTLAQTRHD